MCSHGTFLLLSTRDSIKKRPWVSSSSDYPKMKPKHPWYEHYHPARVCAGEHSRIGAVVSRSRIFIASNRSLKPNLVEREHSNIHQCDNNYLKWEKTSLTEINIYFFVWVRSDLLTWRRWDIWLIPRPDTRLWARCFDVVHLFIQVFTY